MNPVPGTLLLPHGRVVSVFTGGEGQLPVVLLTGLGALAEGWWQAPPLEMQRAAMQPGAWNDRPLLGPEIAAYTRVISYDRAGLGNSTPPTAARDLSSFLDELGGVLGSVATPVILVGHSFGALVAYEYARRFPEQVAGLVLLDSSHPQQGPRFAAVSSEAQIAEEAALWAEWKADHPERPDLQDLVARSGVAVPGSLGDLPLAVVTRGRWPTFQEASVDRPGLTQAQHTGRERVWRELQAEFALASSRATHLQAEQSGHSVHLDQPALALTAIRNVWNLAQQRR